MEAAGGIDTIVFDKTGTITKGEPGLTDLEPVDGSQEDPEEILRVAARAERFSEHPLAKAVVQAALDRGIPLSEPEDFEAFPGLGIRCALMEGKYFLATCVCCRKKILTQRVWQGKLPGWRSRAKRLCFWQLKAGRWR